MRCSNLIHMEEKDLKDEETPEESEGAVEEKAAEAVDEAHRLGGSTDQVARHRLYFRHGFKDGVHVGQHFCPFFFRRL